ncbi:hypothetical protein ACFT7S_11310 [Streptomyces sp. NPDC057136]|uniref:hypothetical protein n=1 Tax=Streptomyces sp. NPDC057136 TaxID=3346029 RepID=UPI003642286A
MFAKTAHALAVTYNELWNQQPELHGVTRQAANRFRNYARAKGWPPPAAWDDDVIDDPAALPEWTGCCGTDRGWWMHTLQKLPMCELCEAAHERWNAKHRGLEKGAFQAALMKSRASASSRGSDIAEDGRELMRLGHSYDTAAGRLGVTLNHLQQELHRHPARPRGRSPTAVGKKPPEPSTGR